MSDDIENVTKFADLHGEFTVIDVNNPAPSKNPLARAHAALVQELSRVVIPQLPANPEPEDFEDVADYILRTARMFDRWHKAVGEDVKASATGRVDMSVFTDAFVAAVDGNSTYVCDAAAEDLREERNEHRLETAYRRSMNGVLGGLGK